MTKHVSQQEIAEFYLAEVFMAIDFLHEHNIIFRDLKPENIMLDREGHARLIDFGLSKVGVSDDPSTFTRTKCGTNCYMAPEVLLKQYYGRGADWWSFGILAFDMFTGGPPFYKKNKDNIQQIVSEDSPIVVPSFLDEGIRIFLQELLVKKPERRLGHPNLGGSLAIRRHDFFLGTDWLHMYLKQVKPPLKFYTQKLTSDTDLTNFDNLPNFDETENVDLMTENKDPQTPTDHDDLQRLFKNFSYCDPNF